MLGFIKVASVLRLKDDRGVSVQMMSGVVAVSALNPNTNVDKDRSEGGNLERCV